jgi:hypothetical protein
VNRRLVISTIGLLGVLAAFAGALSAPSARAVTAHHLYVNPGASSNALTCGWHVACEPPISWGNALDWGNDATVNKNV